MSLIIIKFLFYETRFNPIFKKSFEFQKSDTKLFDKITQSIYGQGLTIVVEKNKIKISAPSLKKVKDFCLTIEKIINEHPN